MSEDHFQSQILSRLDEHGSEIRALRGLVERLVRIEERQQSHSDTFARFGLRIEHLESQVSQLERSCSLSSVSMTWLERALWLLGAVGAWVVSEWVRRLG